MPDSTRGVPAASLALLTAVRRGVLVTLKRDGRPQLSNVGFGYDPATATIRISVTDDRAKTANLRRDPRASLYLANADLSAYLVADGVAELSATAERPEDATVDELAELYRSIAGEHPDWAEFRQAMVDERRLVIRMVVGYTYGFAWPGVGETSS